MSASSQRLRCSRNQASAAFLGARRIREQQSHFDVFDSIDRCVDIVIGKAKKGKKKDSKLKTAQVDKDKAAHALSELRELFAYVSNTVARAVHANCNKIDHYLNGVCKMFAGTSLRLKCTA